MVEQIETVIIGGGQAGLSASYYLKQQAREHVILEQSAQAASAWRNDRWDSFCLNTPNWSFNLPGYELRGDDPRAFMSRERIIENFEEYIQRYQLPIRYNTRVSSVEPMPDRKYLVRTQTVDLLANQVVVATGLFQSPKIPSSASQIPASILQLHSGKYRNPDHLPAGSVLVVGTGQSGCQIAEELYKRGRKVYLCTSSVGRAPRQYRGKDSVEWLNELGFFDRTVEKLPSPAARFAPNPHISGVNGGHTINLHQFVRDGVILLGHLAEIREGVVFTAGDLKENLAKSDQFEADLVKKIDNLILTKGLDAPREELPKLDDGYLQDEICELNLEKAGITSVIWAGGYNFDFSLVHAPVLDEYRFPITRRGETRFPGLFFIGMPYIHQMKSGLLMGVGEDARYITARITGQQMDSLNF